MKPGDYVLELHASLSQGLQSQDYRQFHSTLSSLRVSLASNTISWVQQFGEKGLDIILKTLDDFNQRLVFQDFKKDLVFRYM